MGKIYGYCRISRKTQSIERQERNIREAYLTDYIFKEAFTGTTTERPEFDKLINRVKKGDTIVFDSVSRMSRTAEKGVELYFDLYDKGVNLIFLKEGYINTSVYKDSITQTIGETGNEIADIYIDATNKVIRLLAKQQIEKAFEQAEKEVNDLHQRTKEGIETARINGKQIGLAKGTKLITKKSIEMKEKMQRHLSEFGGNDSDKQFLEDNKDKINRNTFYKYKRELRAARV